MWIRISETMAGWLTFYGKEDRYPFAINIHACCRSFLNYPLPFTFKGWACFRGLPARPAVAGMMNISHKGVGYDFELELEAIGKIRVRGEKIYRFNTLKWNRIRKSLTTLPVLVLKDGNKIGEGELEYRLPLYRFFSGIQLTKPLYAFNPRLKFAHEILPLLPILVPDHKVVVEEAYLVKRIQEQLGHMPELLYQFLKLPLLLLKFLCLLVFQRKMEKLDAKQSERFIRLLSANRFLNLLVAPVLSMITGNVYSSKKFLESKGQNIPVPPQTSESEPWMKLNITPTAHTKHEAIEVDVVVVGSGAGGAALSFDLARRGHAVAIVEEGHYFKRPDMTGDRLEMMGKLYRNHGLSLVLSNAPMWLPVGKCVGGTTVINSGTCMRVPDETLLRWEKELGLGDLNLDKYFPQVEAMLDVKPVESRLCGGIEKVLTKGLKQRELTVQRLNKAETGCDGQSFCILGCPAGAKRSTDVSYVKEAMKKNAYLFSHYRADRILCDGQRASGVRAVLDGYGDEFAITLKARKVVLAAGTLHTPALLYRSNLAGISNHIGKHLSVHPAISVGGLFDYPVREKFYVPQSLGVFGGSSRSPDFVLEGYTVPIDTLPFAFPLYGNDLKELMDNVQGFTNFAAMTRDVVYGSLIFTRWGVIPRYFFNSKATDILKRAVLLLGDIFFDAGARSIYTTIHGYEKVAGREDFLRLKTKKVPAHDFTLSCHHPLGTCRMGSHPENSVVNRNAEFWGMQDLIICDGSVIPGPLGANPQVTIMANALRIADFLSEKL